MKIATIVGARPQFVKAAAVSRSIAAHNADGARGGPEIRESIIHTGQHYDYGMSRVFFEELDIPEPHYNLGIGSGTHGDMTGKMLSGIERLLLDLKPDWVIVYGDTNSTLAGALAASKLHIPVAHVEAGLRSFNRKMPEEINRVLTDHLSALLLCPTQTAIDNLGKEGITSGVTLVGDVMYDSVCYYREQTQPSKQDSDFALMTLHRAENTSAPERLRNILDAVGQSPVPVLLPMHPGTRKKIEDFGIVLPEAVRVLEPAPYLTLLGHLAACRFVITDSGGLQKEAYFFRKKCVTVRDETEWVELVDAGANRVVGAEVENIIEAMDWAMTPIAGEADLYGHGDAADKIIELMLKQKSPKKNTDGHS